MREIGPISEILDEADLRILREVQRDSSRPVTQLAESVGLSHAPCWRRLQRLRSEGFIAREMAVLDPLRCGFGIELFVFVRMNAHGRGKLAEFREEITSHPQVIGVYVLLGSIDAMLHVVARDMRDYERFYMEHLAQSPALAEINSMTVLSHLKKGDLPI
jgi:Lrp/AsnC family transcriptional regulator